MRIVEENTGIFAIRALDLTGYREEYLDCPGTASCEMFVFRNSDTLQGLVNVLNQDCCYLNDFFHKSDSGSVITKSVSFSMEGVNCSFFGIANSNDFKYNDKLVSGLCGDKTFVNLNSVDSYNKEEDYDSGKIEEYTKKYVKLNVIPKEIELVADPDTFLSYFRYLDVENGYAHYRTKYFKLSKLHGILV
jgi:hypothetical protein